jgi:hypothetical protein
MLKPWRKAGYVESGQNFPTDQGTPQGGILFPCLLVFALSGREAAVQAVVPKGESVGAINGDVLHALQRIDDLKDDLEILKENPANKKKLKKAVREFYHYIEANQAFILNDGDRYRRHETISTAFVESNRP